MPHPQSRRFRLSEAVFMSPARHVVTHGVPGIAVVREGIHRMIREAEP